MCDGAGSYLGFVLLWDSIAGGMYLKKISEKQCLRRALF